MVRVVDRPHRAGTSHTPFTRRRPAASRTLSIRSALPTWFVGGGGRLGRVECGPVRRSFSLLSLVAMSFGCGGGSPNLPDLSAAPDAATCEAASGTYAATFTLLESQ